MSAVYYQRGVSSQLTTNFNKRFYLGPFSGDGYDVPTGIILSMYKHHDHNKLDKSAHKPKCIVIHPKGTIVDIARQKFDFLDVQGKAAIACHKRHALRKCCSFIITVNEKAKLFQHKGRALLPAGQVFKF